MASDGVTDADVLLQISEYVHSQITLRELEEFIVPRLPALLTLPPSTVTDLTDIVEMGLAEIGDGVETEEGLKAKLRSVLIFETPTVHVLDSIFTRTGSTSGKTMSVYSPTGDLVAVGMWT